RVAIVLLPVALFPYWIEIPTRSASGGGRLHVFACSSRCDSGTDTRGATGGLTSAARRVIWLAKVNFALDVDPVGINPAARWAEQIAGRTNEKSPSRI